jgi:hypothetical protein
MAAGRPVVLTDTIFSSRFFLKQEMLMHIDTMADRRHGMFSRTLVFIVLENIPKCENTGAQSGDVNVRVGM